MKTSTGISRRTWLAGGLATASCAALGTNRRTQAADTTADAAATNKICAFIKFIQSLPYDELADTIAELGFDGIEATVRNRGYILPERVEDDLPRLVEALRRRNLEISVMTTDVTRADDPLGRRVLRTAAGLGVTRYRMGYYRYDLQRPILEQLAELRSVVRDLAAMNAELGIAAVYQNHSGSRIVGAPIWDLHRLIQDYPIEHIGAAFDIRHATVEGGLSWPVQFQLLRPHCGAVYVKDFRWNGRKPENVPLGQGQVDPAFFPMLAQSDYRGPISVHVEYLEKGSLADNISALGKDLATLRGLIEKT